MITTVPVRASPPVKKPFGFISANAKVSWHATLKKEEKKVKLTMPNTVQINSH